MRILMHSKNIGPGSFFSFKFLEVYLCHREFLFALTAFKFTFISNALFFLKNPIHCFSLETKYANPFGVNKILSKSQLQLNLIFATAKKVCCRLSFQSTSDFNSISCDINIFISNYSQRSVSASAGILAHFHPV